jgi:hypothetical protein
MQTGQADAKGWCMQSAGKGKRVMGGAPPGGRKKGKDAAELQLEQLVDARDVALATGAIDPEAHRRTEIVPIADVRALQGRMQPRLHAPHCRPALLYSACPCCLLIFPN